MAQLSLEELQAIALTQAKLVSALDAIGRGQNRHGIDVVFDAIDAADDPGEQAYRFFVALAQMVVDFRIPGGGKSRLELEFTGSDDMSDPDVAVPTWCARFIAARANDDRANERALFDALHPDRGAMCMAKMLYYAADAVRAERIKTC